MTEPDEPRDDDRAHNALSLSGRITTGDLIPGLPAGELAVKFDRTWKSIGRNRSKAIVSSVAGAAGVEPDDVLQEAAKGEKFADVLMEGVAQASGDPLANDFLGRLVAAALLDDAVIDEVGFILERMEGLTPLAIRVLWELRGSAWGREPGQRLQLKAEKSDMMSFHMLANQKDVSVPGGGSSGTPPVTVSLTAFTGAVRAVPLVVFNAILDLRSRGFIGVSMYELALVLSLGQIGDLALELIRDVEETLLRKLRDSTAT